MARRGPGVSPGGDARGASIHSGLRSRRGLPGCGSARAGTRSLGPAPRCSRPGPQWHRAPGTSARRAPALQGPPAATLPQGGTLPGKTAHPSTQVSAGSSLCPPRFHTGRPLHPVSPPRHCLHSSGSLWTFRPPRTPFDSDPPSQTLLAPSSGLASSRKPPLTSLVHPDGSICSTNFMPCGCRSLVSEPETVPAPPALGCQAGGAQGSLNPQRAHCGRAGHIWDLRKGPSTFTGWGQHSTGPTPLRGDCQARVLFQLTL